MSEKFSIYDDDVDEPEERNDEVSATAYILLFVFAFFITQRKRS
jgi:hypothetical protein